MCIGSADGGQAGGNSGQPNVDFKSKSCNGVHGTLFQSTLEPQGLKQVLSL